jgi:hypothetical protein
MAAMDTSDIPGGRRRYARVPGPFDGWRDGAGGRIPVRILALGIGGCFVNASPEQKVGETFTLHIDLGAEGSVDVSAAPLYHLPDGSAVTFLNLSQDAFERIRRTATRVDQVGLPTVAAN